MQIAALSMISDAVLLYEMCLYCVKLRIHLNSSPFVHRVLHHVLFRGIIGVCAANVQYYYYYIPLTVFPFSRTTWVSRYQKGKPFWILLEQEMMGHSGISWDICRLFAPRSRQITMPVPYHSVFLQSGCSSCRRTNRVKALKT